jgi:hypothetical protein
LLQIVAPLTFFSTIIMDNFLIFLIVFYIILGIFAICAVAAFSLSEETVTSPVQDIELQVHPAI